MKFNYLGPFIHGIAEYRINGEVGYINKKAEIVMVMKTGNCMVTKGFDKANLYSGTK